MEEVEVKAFRFSAKFVYWMIREGKNIEIGEEKLKF